MPTRRIHGRRLEGTETLIVPRLEYQSLRLVSGELAAPCSPQGALSVATQRYLHQYGLLDPESALDEGPILDIIALKKLPKLLRACGGTPCPRRVCSLTTAPCASSRISASAPARP
ncbi:uncharacterized protein ISCGN_007201 [Ixodes scapularis]